MISKLTILTCLVAIAQSRYVGFDLPAPLLGSRVVGGHDAKQGEFPHQVSLQVGVPGKHEFQHFCGGSIIKKNWILTAAHCVEAIDLIKAQLPDAVFTVMAGKLDLSKFEDNEQLTLVNSYFKHNKYIGEGQVGPYDIGLIKVDRPLKLNKEVAAIALPKNNSEPLGNVVLSGWGSINGNPNHFEYPKVLQTVTIPVITRAECNAAVERIAAEQGQVIKNLVHETNVCTGPLTGGAASCSGDSGGPLISKNKDGSEEVIGIVSWGMIPCGRKGAPSVYVRVSSFIDWINQTIQKNSN